MKTAHEVLADEAIIRLRREEEERKWSTLVRQCRTPRGQVPFVAQFILSLILLVVFAIVGQRTENFKGVYFILGAFFFVIVPVHLWEQHRRERALLTMIENEAPHLHRRLKDAGIA